jgi:ABC-type polysaccharide/polyol phosphate export permease
LFPVIALQFAFTAGLGLLTATAYVYFRDTRHLVDVALQIWFWITPVVYSASLVPASLGPVFALNPMAAFITSYHRIVLDASWPAAGATISMIATAAAALAAGLIVFTRHQRRFAEYV